MTSRALVVPALAVLLMLTGCTAADHPRSEGTAATDGPSADWTPMAKSPRPTATADPTPRRTKMSTPSPTADEVYVTKVEFLGTGKATVVYQREGTQNQETVTLPFEHVYNTGTTYDLSDPYIAAGTASLSGGNAGCRITVNNSVVDEILPTATQTSALCDTL